MLSWKQLPAKVLIEVAEICDGHTIFKPEAFTEVGVPIELISKYVHKHYSNTNDYKSTIFDSQGQVMPFTEGVYGLEVIEAINSDLDLPGPNKFGRGFRANQCREQIKSYFGAG